MSATEELRALLDERGVEWIDRSNGYVDVTEYVANGVAWCVITKDYINPDNDWTKIRSERTTPEQAVEATLGDGGYEAKMDALLSLLTNGKFSKSRTYDLDFMVSCVNEEFEKLYAEEADA